MESIVQRGFQSLAVCGKQMVCRNFSYTWEYQQNIGANSQKVVSILCSSTHWEKKMTVPGNISHGNICKTRRGCRAAELMTLSSKWRQMKAVLHTGLDGSFIKVQNGLRCKVSLRWKKRPNSLWCLFCNRPDIRFPIQLGCKTSPRKRNLAPSGNSISFIY